jgi:hypothetical protein
MTETQANDVGSYAERAYALFVGTWGYPAPVSDAGRGGNDKTDIYIGAVASVFSGLTVPEIVYSDTAAVSSSAWIALDQGIGTSPHTVARAVFEDIELGIWNASNRFVVDAPAEWAANMLDGFTAASDPNSTGPAEIALDCFDFNWFPAGLNCANPPVGNDTTPGTDAQANGYSRWTFFELLNERYGTGFVKDVLTRGAASGSVSTSPVDMLSAALAAKGTSLADFYSDWSLANMNGGFSAKPLQVVAPTIYQSVPTGTLASLNGGTVPPTGAIVQGDIPTTTVPVEHLATRYLALIRGDGADTGVCYAATLSLNVTIPNGITSKPYFLWSQVDGDGKYVYTPQALSVSGSTASITVPWDTCHWQSTVGLLSLPNASFSSDAAVGPTFNGQEFTVSGTIKVDTSTLAFPDPSEPPVGPFVPGNVVDVGDDDTVPTIDVFGPELIHLSASSRQLRLIVASDGSGNLQASLGSRMLGSSALRAGNNDVRFTLPASVFTSLRRTAASNVLTLTPMSASGLAGKAVLRHVSVDAPKAKPKAKAKHKAKAKAKHKATKTVKKSVKKRAKH